jgi:hypothetical protein
MEPYVTTARTSRRVAIDPARQEDPYNHYLTHQLVVDFRGNQVRLVNLDVIAKDLQVASADGSPRLFSLSRASCSLRPPFPSLQT